METELKTSNFRPLFHFCVFVRTIAAPLGIPDTGWFWGFPLTLSRHVLFHGTDQDACRAISTYFLCGSLFCRK